MHLLELLLAHEVLRRRLHVLLEQQVERAQAQPGVVGEILGAEIELDVALDVVHQALEAGRVPGGGDHADVVLEHHHQLGGDHATVVLQHLRRRQLGFGLLAEQAQQQQQAVDVLETLRLGAELDALVGLEPAVLGAGVVEHRRGDADDELLAVVRVGEVHRLVRVEHQHVAGGQVERAVGERVAAVALQDELGVVDVAEALGQHAGLRAVAETAQVEGAGAAVAERGAGVAGARQAQAVRAHVGAHVLRDLEGVGGGEDIALAVEEADGHHAVLHSGLLTCV